MVIAGFALVLVCAPVDAQDARPVQQASVPRWRLGAAWRVGAGQQLGGEVHRDLWRRGAVTVRAEGALLLRLRGPSELAYAPPGPDYDGRSARFFGTAGLSAEVGPRTARGERRWFALAGAGFGSTGWGKGTLRSGNGNWPDIDPEGRATTAALVNAGLGVEFPLLGARQRFEFRAERYHDRVWTVDGVRVTFVRAIGR